MATYDLKAEVRKEVGKKANKDLRQQDKIPAVVYSKEMEATPIAIDEADLVSAFQSGAQVINLKIGRKKQTAIYREIQHHPVTEEVQHIDFLGVVEGQAIETRVNIRLLGEPIGVADEGGVLEQLTWDVAIKTVPANLPEAIEIDVSELSIGDAVHVADLEMEGVEILESPDMSIATVVHPTQLVIEEEVSEEEELELEEMEEGELEEGEEPEEGAEEEEATEE